MRQGTLEQHMATMTKYKTTTEAIREAVESVKMSEGETSYDRCFVLKKDGDTVVVQRNGSVVTTETVAGWTTLGMSVSEADAPCIIA